MKLHWPLLAEADDGGGEGGGSGTGGGSDGKGTGSGDSGKGDQNSELMLRGMAAIAKGMTDLQTSNRELLETLKAGISVKDDKGGGSDDKGGRGNDSLDGADVEQMSRPEFAAFLMTKFQDRLQHHLKEALKPVTEQLNGVHSKLEDDLANREVAKAAGARPDFYEWRSEISDIVKQNPALSVTRAYAIARSENAEKAKAMDEKYTKKEDTSGVRFGGMAPAGGGGRGEGATKMKFNEAANKAFDDVIASLGGVELNQLPVVSGKR